MTLAYTTADCVEERLLESLKQKMADMETRLKDRFAAGDISLQGPDAKIDAGSGPRIADLSRLESRDASQTKKSEGRAPQWSEQVTPSRKVGFQQAQSLQNSNSRQAKKMETHENLNLEPVAVGKNLVSADVAARYDIQKLKERLRKALPADDLPPKSNMSTGLNFKPQQKIEEKRSVLEESRAIKSNRQLEFIKIEHLSSTVQSWKNHESDPIREISSRSRNVEVPNSIRLGDTARRASDFGANTDTNKYLSRTMSADVINTSSHTVRIFELDMKIAKLRRENSSCESSFTSKTNQISKENVKPPTATPRYDQQKSRDHNAMSSGVKLNLQKMLAPSDSVKIPAYLMSGKLTRPSPRLFPNSTRAEAQKSLLYTPIKEQTSMTNHLGHTRTNSRTFAATPFHQNTIQKHYVPLSSNSAMNKMENIFGTFSKTRAYWEPIKIGGCAHNPNFSLSAKKTI
jgi:hypothetical protein